MIARLTAALLLLNPVCDVKPSVFPMPCPHPHVSTFEHFVLKSSPAVQHGKRQPHQHAHSGIMPTIDALNSRHAAFLPI